MSESSQVSSDTSWAGGPLVLSLPPCFGVLMCFSVSQALSLYLLTHPLCNLSPTQELHLILSCIILKCLPKNGNLNPRLLNTHPPAQGAHPGPHSLPFITASTLPWLLLPFPWKSLTKHQMRASVLHLKWWLKSLWTIISGNSCEGEESAVSVKVYLVPAR